MINYLKVKMWLISFVVIALISIPQGSWAAAEDDLVTDLPGLSKQPPFKQYSGYLKGDTVGDKFLHYWFVESSSNPHTDPVVLWLNGGPGCSSDLGFLTEHGPFQIENDGVNLRYNSYAWNQAANMIYLESPVGVGFSYSKSENVHTNDTAVAKENAIAIADFFDKFPEYKLNEFYITGESYGGIYVPTLAVEILANPGINLKGFAVGNGLSDNDDNDNSLIYFAYYHGLIGDVKWNFLLNNCCPENGPSRCNFVKAASTIQQCNDEYVKLSALIEESGLDIYNLYAECAGGVNTGFSSVYRKAEEKFVSSYFGWPLSFLDKARMEREKLKLIPTSMLRLDPPCVNTGPSSHYLNTPSVVKALHVNPAIKWEACSSAVNLGYGRLYTTMAEFYKKALDHKLRIMVFNGDVDMACNFLGDEWFVNSLPLEKPSGREFWYYKANDGTKQIAGFIKTFNQLSLVTVKGAGHMVPKDKPVPALEMFINFIQDRAFIKA